MPYCHKCGAENPDGGKFCVKCGTQLLEVARTEPSRPSIEVDSPPSFGLPLSTIGGLVAFFGFFMPWATVSCTGMSMNGLDIALQSVKSQSAYPAYSTGSESAVILGLILFLVPLASVITVIVGAGSWNRGVQARRNAAGTQMAMGFLGLVPILLVWLGAQVAKNDPQTLGMLYWIEWEPGFWITIMSFGAVIAGAFLERSTIGPTVPGRVATAMPPRFDAIEALERELESKKCPRCAELVKSEAMACRFCGHEFTTEELEADKERRDGIQARINAIRKSLADEEEIGGFGRVVVKCATCSTINPLSLADCRACGHDLSSVVTIVNPYYTPVGGRACPACGNPVPATAAACPSCGKRVERS